MKNQLTDNLDKEAFKSNYINHHNNIPSDNSDELSGGYKKTCNIGMEIGKIIEQMISVNKNSQQKSGHN